MSQWFIQTDDATAEIGPLRPNELLQRVREGGITPQTKLRKGDSAWFPASEVGGLFEAASKPDIIYRCPYCSKKIAKPPTECGHCRMDVHKAFEQQVPREPVTVDGGPAVPKKSIKRWLAKKKLG